MTSPNDIASHLLELARTLDGSVKELARLEDAAVRAKCRHEVAFAEAFLRAEGSVDARRFTATLATQDRKLDAEISAAQVRGQQEAIRSLRTRIDVGRTVSATVRSEISLAGVGT